MFYSDTSFFQPVYPLSESIVLICPACHHSFPTEQGRCKHCGFSPDTVDGFVAWAPNLMSSYEGFPQESFEELAAVEADNFWFRARNQLIVWALAKYFPDFRSLLEVGCGTGFVLSGIANRFPGAKLTGSEIFTHGLVQAVRRLPHVELIQADARRLPYRDEFDVVTAFDVIEHIKEDEAALANLYQAAKPGAGCLITVPQHQWLWSSVDEEACHVRRYSAQELHTKIEKAGFRIVMSTSFVSLLLPAMLLSRLVDKRAKKSESSDELRLPRWMDRLFSIVMALEATTIKLGLRWPFGGSRMVVAIKNKTPRES